MADENYDKLLKRIEEEIDVEELNVRNIKDLIGNKAYSRLSIGIKDRIFLRKTILERIKKARELDELQGLKEEAGQIGIYQKETKEELFDKAKELGVYARKRWKRFGLVEVVRDKNGGLVTWRKVRRKR